MPSLLDRWKGRLATRRQLLSSAQADDKAHPSPAADAKVAHRQQQVGFAERVVARHSTKTIPGSAIQHVVPTLSAAHAAQIGAALGPAFAKYGITTPARAAAAVAQFAEESASFQTTTEYGTGAEYNGRADLGNTHPGDGERYKGRGYIQITGRNNYAALGKALGVDFIDHPELVAEPQYAADASCWWWDAHGCNQLADAGDFVGLTRRINGGTNGLAQREANWARAKQVANELVPS
jgi:putative chitinase